MGEDFSHQGKLDQRLKQQPGPKNAPKGITGDGWNYVGSVKRELLERTYDRERKKNRELLVEVSTPQKNRKG
jgi:hypothetical protein